jgi:hypothetical protein
VTLSFQDEELGSARVSSLPLIIEQMEAQLGPPSLRLFFLPPQHPIPELWSTAEPKNSHSCSTSPELLRPNQGLCRQPITFWQGVVGGGNKLGFGLPIGMRVPRPLPCLLEMFPASFCISAWGLVCWVGIGPCGILGVWWRDSNGSSGPGLPSWLLGLVTYSGQATGIPDGG